jgi:lipase
VRLQVFEWGYAEAPPVVCVHGATGHGLRFGQLAEESWARQFHVFAVDLRGHGRSGWQSPWTIETHIGDLLETLDARGLRQPDWVGHSFGGRLVVEVAAKAPERIRRAVLLDPAIQLPARVVDRAVAAEMREPVWKSVAACFASRDDTDGADERRALADLELQLDPLPDGRLRRRTSQEAVRAIYREVATTPPPPESLTMPVQLVYAPTGGVVTDQQASAYGRDGVVAVPGGHMLMWSAFDKTAATVEEFLTS